MLLLEVPGRTEKDERRIYELFVEVWFWSFSDLLQDSPHKQNCSKCLIKKAESVHANKQILRIDSLCVGWTRSWLPLTPYLLMFTLLCNYLPLSMEGS